MWVIWIDKQMDFILHIDNHTHHSSWLIGKCSRRIAHCHVGIPISRLQSPAAFSNSARSHHRLGDLPNQENPAQSNIPHGWLRNPTPVENGGKHPIIAFLLFQVTQDFVTIHSMKRVHSMDSSPQIRLVQSCPSIN